MKPHLLKSPKCRKDRHCTFVLLLVLSTVLFVGCSTNRENLVKSGHVTLQKQATGKVEIAWCKACEEDNGIVITGVVRRYDTVGAPIQVRVGVAVISPDGKTLDEACSSVISVPRRRVGRLNQSWKRFTVRLPELPPQGSSVSVVTKSEMT
jgi:hypothetical protein